MGISQQMYFEAIGRAGLVYSDGVNDAIDNETAGCTPDWEYLLCELKNIECAQFFFNNADYSSDDSLYFYTKMLEIAGTQYSDATIDPNAQIPGVIIVLPPSSPLILHKTETNLIDADSPNGQWYLPFLTDNGNSIDNSIVPVSVKVNGETFTFTFSTNFIPPRIYGFANNDSQVIIVTAI